MFRCRSQKILSILWFISYRGGWSGKLFPFSNMLPTFSVGSEHNKFTRHSRLPISHNNSWLNFLSTEGCRDFKLNSNIPTIICRTHGSLLGFRINVFKFNFSPTVLSISDNVGFFAIIKIFPSNWWSNTIYIAIFCIWIIGRFFGFCSPLIFHPFFIDFSRLEWFQRFDSYSNYIARHDFLGIGSPNLKSQALC